jgi:membrane associated rhomboid family serine protease
MGIYDRDYVFGRSAPQRRRLLSINAWIIIINCIVFFGGFMLRGLSTPVYVKPRITDATYAGEPLKAVGPYLDPRDFTPADRRTVTTPNAVLLRPVVDANTGQPIDGYLQYVVMPPLHAWGHFSTFQAVNALQVWRLLTFQFLHAGITHLAFNMLGLYVFGPMVEQYLGSKRYLAFYLTCGIAGGLGYLILNLAGYVASTAFGWNAIPGLLYNESTTPLVGASAGVFGVILGCAFISPNTIVQLLFPPIPMRLKTMAYAYVAIAVAAVIFDWKNAGGEAAHLGGAIAGAFLIRNAHLLRDFFDVLRDSRKPPAFFQSKITAATAMAT